VLCSESKCPCRQSVYIAGREHLEFTSEFSYVLYALRTCSGFFVRVGRNDSVFADFEWRLREFRSL